MVRKKPSPKTITKADLIAAAKLASSQALSEHQKKAEKHWDNQESGIDVVLEKISNLEEQLKESKDEISSIKKDMQALNDIASRWKGALFVILCLGGFIGWVSTVGDKIWMYIHGGG